MRGSDSVLGYRRPAMLRPVKDTQENQAHFRHPGGAARVLHKGLSRLLRLPRARNDAEAAEAAPALAPMPRSRNETVLVVEDNPDVRKLAVHQLRDLGYVVVEAENGPMKNLICFTTPVDFREMKLFQNFSDKRYFDVDRLVDSVGNVPPEMILSSFEMLRPASRIASQVQLWENIWNDEYVKSYRMFDRWATDTLPLAGEYFRTITKDLMWDNKLYNDAMSVGGRPADISKITVPVLHAVAEHDHIVPYDAAKPLIQKIGSTDKEEVMLKGGHVSLVAGANAVKRLWPKLDSWLGERSI